MSPLFRCRKDANENIMNKCHGRSKKNEVFWTSQRNENFLMGQRNGTFWTRPEKSKILDDARENEIFWTRLAK